MRPAYVLLQTPGVGVVVVGTAVVVVGTAVVVVGLGVVVVGLGVVVVVGAGVVVVGPSVVVGTGVVVRTGVVVVFGVGVVVVVKNSTVVIHTYIDTHHKLPDLSRSHTQTILSTVQHTVICVKECLTRVALGESHKIETLSGIVPAFIQTLL